MKLHEILAAPLDYEKCEGTSFPYWVLLDPKILAGRCMSYLSAAEAACMSLHGPFFSRESAEGYRKRNAHNLSGHEIIWCATGHMSRDYLNLLDLAQLEKEKEK